MLFHFPQTPLKTKDIPTLSLNQTNLKYVKQYKFLGITFDETLSWSQQIQNISTKTSQVCGVLNKLKTIFPLPVLKTIYYSLIHSHLIYGILLWGFKNINRLQLVQKKSLRIITKSHYYAHTNPICRSLNIILLEDILKLYCAKFFYKFVHNILPEYFQHNFISYARTHNQLTRNRYPTNYFGNFILNTPNLQPILNIPHSIRSSTTHCLRFSLPKLINERQIPPSVIEFTNTHTLQTLSTFYKKMILNNYTDCNEPFCFSCNYVRILL